MIKCTSLFFNYPIPYFLQKRLKDYNYVLNPSYVALESKHYLAIRVCENKESNIEALLFIWDDNNHKELNLTSYFKTELALVKVADPKLFVMNNKVWCTFNTGYVNDIQNDIVLALLDFTGVKNYYKCFFNKRARIEKNWAFFYYENQIKVLYGLRPLKLLKVEKQTTNELHFVKDFESSRLNTSYSIGTPLVQLDKLSYGFLVHRKIEFKGKRIYLGRSFKLELANSYNLTEGKHFLIHSLRALLGSKFKFNKNLWSCTYFSSLHKLDTNTCVIGYGINDVNWRLKKVRTHKIWH